jgi:hypothetical protein
MDRVVYDEGELTQEATVKDYLTVQKEAGRFARKPYYKLIYSILYDNLIISINKYAYFVCFYFISKLQGSLDFGRFPRA